MTENLTRRTLRGAFWSYVSTILNVVMQVGFTAVLARLVAPTAFGLVAMGSLALRFGQYFSQMGLGQALVQIRETTAEDVSACFTTSLALGLVTFGVFWAAAPFVQVAFAAAGLAAIVRWLATSFVFAGASLTSLALLRRNMRFRDIALIDTVAYAVGYGVIGIVMAFRGYGVWSLVVAGVAQSALSCFGYYLAARHSLRLSFGGLGYRRLLPFGSMVSVIGFLEFVGSNLDTMSVGRLLGAAILGFYSRALNLANLPMQYLSTSLTRVLLPSLAAIQDDGERLRDVYLAALTLFGAVALPIAAGMSAASRELVAVLLGPRWGATVPLLALLAVAAPFTVLTHFGEVVCEARAVLRLKLYIRIAQVTGFAALVFLLRSHGAMGLAGAFVISELGMHVAYLFVMRRELSLSASDLGAAYVPMVFYSAAVYAVTWLAVTGVRALGLAAAFGLAGGIVAAAVCLLALVLFGLRGRVWSVARSWLLRSAAEEGERTRKLVQLVDNVSALRGADVA